MNQHDHNSNASDGAGAAAEASMALVQPLVYVKGVNSSEMPGLNGLPPDTIVYAIHSAEGLLFFHFLFLLPLSILLFPLLSNLCLTELKFD